MEVAIIGGGNFGTALANIVARNGLTTYLWMRDEQQVAECLASGENERYLPGHPLEPLVKPTADLELAVKQAEIVAVSVPSASFREVTGQLAPFIGKQDILVSCTKGIEAAGFRLMSQVLEELTVSERIGVISGPNLAEEIADGDYTGTVIASREPKVCEQLKDVLRSETFRVYVNDDVYGVELGGALKNIYAIVCGIAGGLGVGQNTMGLLITRSLAEMSRFAVSMGANPFTFLGLAGVGDLLVTCTSPLSRNYQLGYRLGQGLSLDQALADLGKLAEGVNTLKVVHAKADERSVYMPLVSGLHRVLFEREALGDVIRDLMTGGQSQDVEFALPS